MITRTLLLQMAGSKKLESFLKRNRLSSRAAARFVAGETIEDAGRAAERLNQEGITVTLDYLGESVTNEQEVAEIIDMHLRLFQYIKSENLKSNVSIKLTSIGLDIDEESCYRNVERLLTAAGPDLFLRLDMEGSAYTQTTLDLFYRLWAAGFRNVGVVIQAYLRRSEQDINRLVGDGVRVRLCKGAYKEGADVAFPDKSDVDKNYIKLSKLLLEKGNYPALATHDPAMIASAKEYAREHSITADRFEFQMLYGVRRDIQKQLIHEGYRVRVYTPFGTHWYPYFMRRLAERPANVWFVLKNMLYN